MPTNNPRATYLIRKHLHDLPATSRRLAAEQAGPCAEAYEAFFLKDVWPRLKAGESP